MQPRIRLFDGALKVVVLHPGLCVGYAGDSTLAQNAIRDLAIDRHKDFSRDAVTALLAARSAVATPTSSWPR